MPILGSITHTCGRWEEFKNRKDDPKSRRRHAKLKVMENNFDYGTERSTKRCRGILAGSAANGG